VDTPVVGSTFAIAVLSLGVGLIRYIHRFFPDEVAVQERHDGPSDELARKTVAAQYQEAGDDVGILLDCGTQCDAGCAADLAAHPSGCSRAAPASATLAVVRQVGADGPSENGLDVGLAVVGGEGRLVEVASGEGLRLVGVEGGLQRAGDLHG